MASSRGEANQALYRARILLDAWDRSRGQGTSDDHLLGAFMPAVRLHLCDAYGWFLLSVAGVEKPESPVPPRSVTQLPRPDAGKALAPELVEFAGLERTGWLASMLESGVDEPGRSMGQVTQPAGGGMLLGSDRAAPGYAVARDWAAKLADTMARMDDSLNEC